MTFCNIDEAFKNDINKQFMNDNFKNKIIDTGESDITENSEISETSDFYNSQLRDSNILNQFNENDSENSSFSENNKKLIGTNINNLRNPISKNNQKITNKNYFKNSKIKKNTPDKLISLGYSSEMKNEILNSKKNNYNEDNSSIALSKFSTNDNTFDIEDTENTSFNENMQKNKKKVTFVANIDHLYCVNNFWSDLHGICQLSKNELDDIYNHIQTCDNCKNEIKNKYNNQNQNNSENDIDFDDNISNSLISLNSSNSLNSFNSLNSLNSIDSIIDNHIYNKKIKKNKINKINKISKNINQYEKNNILKKNTLSNIQLNSNYLSKDICIVILLGIFIILFLDLIIRAVRRI
jgi:hypothetical protein